MSRFTTFETAVGRCAVLWRGEHLTGVLLPAANDDAMLKTIARRDAGAAAAPPPPFVQDAIKKIISLCAGEPVSFEEVPLDRSAIEPLANRVYDILLRTPFGETTTYGAIAEKLGDKALSRAVGAALADNPFPIVIPCHRVVAAGGKMGGFTAPGGTAAKRRLLDIEGAFAADKLPLFGR
ncbi:MAG: MGMT family protein [Parvularculaceae bacterium]|nr:MGMT family protein [Parvularculaceae bacterium]